MPLPGYVLISPIEDEGKSAGGVYLPDSSKDKPMKGKVVEVGGPTLEMRKTVLKYKVDINFLMPKEGKIVYYKKWVNETVASDGKEYLFVRFEDLLGIENDS